MPPKIIKKSCQNLVVKKSFSFYYMFILIIIIFSKEHIGTNFEEAKNDAPLSSFHAILLET